MRYESHHEEEEKRVGQPLAAIFCSHVGTYEKEKNGGR